jgi:uncharacterized repeat protein (TIGR04052 family)
MAYLFGRWLAAACVAGFTLAGCGDDSDDAGPVEMKDVELKFEARVGDKLAACGEVYAGLGKNNRSASLADMRWYVYDVKLIDKRGNAVKVELTDDELVQWQNVALLDFEDGSEACENGSSSTNDVVRGKVPAGDYTGVSFGIGMTPEQSHGNPAEQKSPLTIQALSWSWRLGHKFLRIDLELEKAAGEVNGGFEIHLGATGCSGQQNSYSCTHENTPVIELDAFNAERDKIVFDLKQLVADVELQGATEPGPLAGCTSEPDDPECEPLLTNLGVDVNTGKPADTQTVFSVEAR